MNYTNHRNMAVAVKCEGCFTEWYAPTYNDPYEDNADYRNYYDKHLLDIQPVSGPALGDSEDATLTSDLDCLCERLCANSDHEDWLLNTTSLKCAILGVLRDGKERRFHPYGLFMDAVKIIPYTKEELPPINPKSLALYGDFQDLVRERVEAI